MSKSWRSRLPVVPPLPRPATFNAAAAAPPPDLHAIARQEVEARGFRFESIADYLRAYREGTTHPLRVADALIAALAQVDATAPPLRAITAFKVDEIRAHAKASAERHRQGRLLSPLDGVPIAVKEEFDVAGYKTTAGTSFLDTVAAMDATVVGRLRPAGALIYGKTNMHEIGIDVTVSSSVGS